MRQVTEVLTCDVCGKTSVSHYIHIGVDKKIERAGVIGFQFKDDDIYEDRPTRHLCGKCLKAINSAADVVAKEIRKRGDHA